MKTTALEEFKKISAVPRRSFHNEKIIDYCLKRAEELGCETCFDEKNKNVLIRKAAAAGKENHPGIVLQGHLDMVAQTDRGIRHDWENEGLELIQEGDLLTANGTTLGADNGVAPAIAFALLSEDDLKNPPLEVFLTTDEEVGMCSVRDADLSYLKGKYLFNLDSIGEGEFVTGCCGGRLTKIWIPDERESREGKEYRILVSGLNGGHSGNEIGKERANALKLLGTVLREIEKQYDFRIADVVAEGKDNAISKEAFADILITGDHKKEDIETLVQKCEEQQKMIYRKADPILSIRLRESEAPVTSVLTEKSSRALCFLLHTLPFGAINRDQSLDGSVETSANPGLVEKGSKGIGIVVSIRSSVAERGLEVMEKIRHLAEICGAEFEEAEKAYPSWVPDPDSPLITLFSDMYRKMYGKEPKVGPVHAGLECGYILSNSSLEAAIAIGPNMTGEHTTQETLSISSLERTYAFVKAVIEEV